PPLGPLSELGARPGYPFVPDDLVEFEASLLGLSALVFRLSDHLCDARVHRIVAMCPSPVEVHPCELNRPLSPLNPLGLTGESNGRYINGQEPNGTPLSEGRSLLRSSGVCYWAERGGRRVLSTSHAPNALASCQGRRKASHPKPGCRRRNVMPFKVG